MDRTNVMVEFIIIGEEFDPNFVTEKLNIEPDEFWVKGDAIKGRNIKRKDTTWSINTGYEESLDISEQLEKIINLINGKKNILKELKIEYNLEYVFGIVVNVEDNQKPSMYFNNMFIEFVNDIKAEFYIDLYIY